MSWHQPNGSYKGADGKLRNAAGNEINDYGTDL
jgi:hypothetical protein